MTWKKLKPGGEYTMGNFESSPDAINLKPSQVKWFPPSEDVFIDLSEGLENEILPICSFELSFSLVDPEFDGIACFFQAYREYAVYPSQKWYNQYCKDYVLGFRQTGSKLKLLGQKELFGASKEMGKDKEDYKSYFDACRNQFYEKGISSFSPEFSIEKVIRQVGSEPRWVQNNETPQNEGIRFIAQLDPDLIGLDLPYLFLFFDPKEKVFFQIEQFT